MPPKVSSPVTPPAVVLVSGGLDSAVALATARATGAPCHALTFDYGQRHRIELEAARAVAAQLGAERHIVLPIGLRAFGGSALTSDAIDVPKDRALENPEHDIPVTYVPARNLIFLSCAAALAETIDASDIYIGVNAVDYSGYPDCRPAFIEAFARCADLATRAGAEGGRLRICTPLMDMSKAEIIRAGAELGVDFSLTHSCYDPDGAGRACGGCDSCVIRRAGFEAACVTDPTKYTAG